MIDQAQGSPVVSWICVRNQRNASSRSLKIGIRPERDHRGTHRVMPAGRPGVTARDALGRQPAAAHGPCVLMRLERVLRAARVVAAAAGRRAAGEQRRDHVAPGQDEAAQRPAPLHARAALTRAPRRCPCQQLAQLAGKPGEAARVCRLGEPGAGDAHDVDAAGAASASSAKASRRRRLSRLRSTAPPTLRDTESPSRGLAGVARLTREGVDHEVARGRGPSTPVDGVELGGAREPAPAFRLGRGHSGQAESRLRPRARRRLMITRPARVDMRLRKPCVLARLRRFGW